MTNNSRITSILIYNNFQELIKGLLCLYLYMLILDCSKVPCMCKVLQNWYINIYFRAAHVNRRRVVGQHFRQQLYSCPSEGINRIQLERDPPWTDNAIICTGLMKIMKITYWFIFIYLSASQFCIAMEHSIYFRNICESWDEQTWVKRINRINTVFNYCKAKSPWY